MNLYEYLKKPFQNAQTYLMEVLIWVAIVSVLIFALILCICGLFLLLFCYLSSIISGLSTNLFQTWPCTCYSTVAALRNVRRSSMSRMERLTLRDFRSRERDTTSTSLTSLHWRTFDDRLSCELSTFSSQIIIQESIVTASRLVTLNGANKVFPVQIRSITNLNHDIPTSDEGYQKVHLPSGTPQPFRIITYEIEIDSHLYHSAKQAIRSLHNITWPR